MTLPEKFIIGLSCIIIVATVLCVMMNNKFN